MAKIKDKALFALRITFAALIAVALFLVVKICMRESVRKDAIKQMNLNVVEVVGPESQ